MSCAEMFPASYSEANYQPLLLRGETESVTVEELDSEEVLIKIKLKMELTNKGANPIFLLNKEPLFVGASIAKSTDDLASGVLLASNYAGPAVDKSPYWGNLRASLEQMSPPPDKIRVLKPNDTWFVITSIVFGVPAKTGGSISFRKQESWSVIQKLPHVWLKVVCEVWPRNIEPGANRSKLEFGHNLQRRWHRHGVLWLDDLVSEPIQIDLKGLPQKP